MASEVTLFDLPSKGRCACWSLNPWKTRLLLNFKGVPYNTEWVEYPSVEAKLKSYGIPSNEQGAAYTIPAILLPASSSTSPEAYMDSQKIAAVLEARYPTPSLHLDDPALAKIEAVFPKLMPSLAPNIMPLVPVNLLNPPSAEYFQRTRAMRFGMPLDEFHALKGGEQAWEATGPVIAEIAAILKEDGSGPFIMGKTPSYADFYVASMLTFLERVDPKLLERWMAFDPVFGELYTACQPWLQRDQ